MISLRDVVTGFGNRDPLAEVWRRSLRGGGGGSTVITGVPPLRYIGDGRPLTDYRIAGNALQDGTPSPDAPVDATGCGVRTGNLWNEEGFSAIAITSTHEHTDTNTYGTTLSTTIGKETIITQSEYPTGTVGYQNGFFFIGVDFSKYEIGDKVTLSFDYICNEVHSIEGQISTTLYAGKNNNSIPAVLSSGKWSVSGRLTAFITVIADMNPYVEVRLCGNSITVKNIMLNIGSTALPYEPYGYKLPPTVNGTEYPIYLGQVKSTRRVKKLVLTGKENFKRTSNGCFYWTGGITDYSRVQNVDMCRCTHFGSQPLVWGTSAVTTNNIAFYQSTVKSEFYCAARNISSDDDFKSYLAAQYAAGTPVTLWYVLAEPETAIVNEPLMKIGDYADTISFAQAGVAIPTVNGENILTVPTTVPPSEVTIKGGISSV